MLCVDRWLDFVPTESKAAVWKQVAEHGMTAIGDYGDFVYMSALAADPTVDDGKAMHTALTKCDDFSWCATIGLYGATMTRESLDDTVSNRKQSARVRDCWNVSDRMFAVARADGLTRRAR